MTMGMVQLLAIGFEGNEFKGEIVPQINALREQGLIRLLDLLFVLKNANGEVISVETSDLSEEDRIRLGMTVGSLIGLGAEGIEGAEAGAQAGAEAAAEGDLGFSREDIEEIAAEMDNNSSALLVLFEHVWSIPFKQAVINSNGRLLGQWIIQPEMLVELGAELETARMAESAP